MKSFEKLAGLFARREQKASAVSHLQRGSETVWLGLGDARWSNRTYRSLAEEGYKKNVVAHRSVKLLAESAASVPLVLFRDGRRLDHHPVLDLLARPNPMQGRMTFFESLFSFLNIAGNSYVELVRGADGQPSELYVLRADRIRLDQDRSGWPKAYVYSLGGREHVFPVDPVEGKSSLLHLKYFHPLDDLYGLSPLEAAAMAVDVHNAASAWNKALFDNAARPSGALVFEGREGQDSLSGEQFDRLKDELADSYQGARNAGRPMLLEGGLKWQKLAFSPADMDFINGKHVSAREIALAFGIPPMLLGIPGDNTYSNFQEANRALWRLTLLPMLERVVSSLNGWLCPEYGPDLRLAFDQDAIPALSHDRQLLWERVGAADFLTVDEKRAAVGLGPLEQAE
ncbi:phage portal protein [Emcibacter sp.]|uniref:phage portal protein n=1 Tax=Emcibacter sp. TaxID=1979954 RepID=UPI003A95C2D7